ncbi:MAG TPA: hypothetical protein VK524_06555 [Polyangiaceae bacterium]|nr:hypothetical protein [Polyangiaceae bacterium]
MKGWRLGVCVVSLLLAARPALAQSGEGAEPEKETLSDLEQSIVEQALERHGFERDPQPDGKRIQSIEIVRLEVFDERDPVPDFINVFHVTSREYVIERELLFREGERYDPLKVAESARNLRTPKQLSVVLVLAVRGSTDDEVRVLVITKDVWSLRLNWDVKLSNGRIASLVLNPTEQNLLGTHTSIGFKFRLLPDTYSLGGQFSNTRVFGTRMQASIGANAIFNRDSGESEGSYGSAFFGQPLFSVASKWGFQTAVAWLEETSRSFIGLDQRVYDARPRALQAAACAGDSRCIPYEYFSERAVAEASAVRSFGKAYKYDLRFGAELDHRDYAPPNLAAYDADAGRAFVRDVLPVSDTRISPILELHAYDARFVRLLDFETLSLQEDVSLGHELLWRVYPASRDLGSSRDLIGTYAALSYTLPISDGIVRALAASNIELAAQEKHDALFEGALRFVTPRFAFGRFVYDALLLNRYRNYLNRRFVLGGDTRLRGYAPSAFIGKDVVASTLEFRSRPIEILSAQVGAAVFYDAGDAFDGFESVAVKHGAGAGVRILFPQLDRTVFRADWGFPLNPGYSTWPGSFFVTFKQAFALPGLGSPSITTSFVDGLE